ncbi:MAG: prenyltransferase/squalene oxidase repeat-containing protein [Bythopirellula sp.]
MRASPVEESNWRFSLCVACALLSAVVQPGRADEEVATTELLSSEQWQQVDHAVERGLEWLASTQQRDGSFPTLPQGQPGVTSLCILSFLSHGHLPGEGRFGDQLNRAVDYVIGCQKRNGVLALTAPNTQRLTRKVSYLVGSTAAYNHAISGLALSETYGLQSSRASDNVRPAVRKALEVTLEMQDWPKDLAADRGGWRYLLDFDRDDSDVSITGWHLMFLRSAKNAGFDVPKQPVDEAVSYVRGCFRPTSNTFVYTNSAEYANYRSRGISGAGILALAHAGQHHTPEAMAAGEWLLKNGFNQYNHNPVYLERYHYGLLTCSQAMYQLGGKYWKNFFPSTARTLVNSQRPDGSWQRESHHRDQMYGEAYTTAICLITLGTPNDLLPIFQR